jgi:hypothetical protein
VRPQVGQLEELDAVALSHALGLSLATTKRRLALWHSLGVEGVRREASVGREGYRYLAAADLPARWRDGRLPGAWAGRRAA